MRKLIKNRVNIFDKLAFGISFIPFLCFCTMFTYYFNDGLIVNSSDISSKGMLKRCYSIFFQVLVFLVL